MPKISIRTLDEAKTIQSPPAYGGVAKCLAYFDGGEDPLHLHLQELASDDCLRIECSDIDRLAYVWQGRVRVGEVALTEGSSLIVEHGEALEMTSEDNQSQVLVFAAATPHDQSKAGGHIHLLPAERVPRATFRDGISGGLHADSACTTCELWLHENQFSGQSLKATKNPEQGVHSHSENEIIFVTEGEMRLGRKLYGPGTALAIAADTLYSFTPGPQGLGFVNFRASMPGDIQFRHGEPMSETGLWRNLVPRPDYLTVN